jgi:3',5'-cyclic AMP phosphodiesterase CpdA
MESCLHRREFLGLAAGSVTLGAIGSMVGAAPAGAAVPTAGPLEFAIVSDTHVNVSAVERQQWLANVLIAIAAREPAFVLHCGDVTDTGVADEYEIYDRLLPAALRGRVHYTPGNHEVRWDGSAQELYHGHFGPAPYAFEAAGIRFIGFDPTQQLQEPGHYSDAHLAWLDRQLHGDTPSFLFQHHPMGDDFYYVDDQDRFFDLVRRHPLRGILAGHIHADHVSRFNGQTQVAFNAVKNGPMYYWARLNAGSIEITRVDVADDGTQTTKPAATVPLSGGMAAPRPSVIDLGRVTGGALPVRVRLGAGETPVSVGALAYPQAVWPARSRHSTAMVIHCGHPRSGRSTGRPR